MNSFAGDCLSGLRVSVAVHGFTIIRDVSLQLPRGQIMALLGPNGAGKTTLLKALLGLLPLAHGTVAIAGQEVSGVQQRARSLAYVPQQSRLAAHVSARQVVEWGRFPHRGNRLGLSRHDHEVVAAVMQECDCAYLQQRAFVDCSGGEQARLLLARALATEAPFLLLDEPGAALDVAHRLQLYDLLSRLAASGRGILIAMHQLEDALRWADSALLLASGQVVTQGPAAQVVTARWVRQVYGVEMIANAGPRYQLPRPGEEA